MNKHNLFLLLFFCGFTQFLVAQNNTWVFQLAPADYGQYYSAPSKTFPDDFVDKYGAEGMSITDVTYSPEGWRVLMSESAVYGEQMYQKSKAFPSDFVEKSWADGYSLTKVAYGGGEWLVVMSQLETNAGEQGETYDFAETYDQLFAQVIKPQWNNKHIISIAYGNGMWIAVMASNPQWKLQKILRGSAFPSKEVTYEYENNNRNVTSISYGDGKWVVVCTELEEPYLEGVITSPNFPTAELQEMYDDSEQPGRIVCMHYNYEKPRTSSYQEYFAAGNAALNAKKYDEAIGQFSEAIRISPTAEAYNNLAWAKYCNNQCQGALADIERSLTLKQDPNSVHTRGAINLCLGRCSDALKDFDKVIATATKKEAVYYGDRAKAKACLGDLSAAIADFDAALKLEPNNAEYKKGKADAEAKIRQNNVVPTINWDYPSNAFTAATKPTFELKACVNAEGATIQKTQIFLNGKDISINSRGFDVVDDCDARVQQTINLQNGINEVEIVLTTNRQTVRSEKRSIEYKSSGGGNYHALLIGVSNYNDMSMKDLDAPVKDINKLKDVLTKNYTFNSGDVHVLESPKKEDILAKLVYLQERMSEKDNLVIFYAGHGIVKNEVGYWLPSDAEKENRVKWLSNAEIRDYIHGMKAKHVLVVADACFSGSLLSGSYRDVTEFACQEMAKVPSRRAMTSGANTVVPDQSVFFQYLIKNLENNNAACFSAEDLYSKLKPAVINNSPNQQIPQFGVLPQAGDEGGNFIFKRK